MAIKVIALVTVNEADPMALAAYLNATTPLLEEAGAKIVERVQLNDTVAGEVQARTMIVVEYPDRVAVDHVFQSEAYRQIIPIRDRAFLHYSVSIVAG